MSFISVEHVNYLYPQSKTPAVDDVSFVIEKGSYTAVVGSNGSGKSTLARMLAGLLPVVNLPGREPGKIQIPDGIRVGLVFQSPKNQIVSGIVSRDTAFGPQNLGLKPAEVELRTIECLNVVDILQILEVHEKMMGCFQSIISERIVKIDDGHVKTAITSPISTSSKFIHN